jgi:hypothetical protein
MGPKPQKDRAQSLIRHAHKNHLRKPTNMACACVCELAISTTPMLPSYRLHNVGQGTFSHRYNLVESSIVHWETVHMATTLGTCIHQEIMIVWKHVNLHFCKTSSESFQNRVKKGVYVQTIKRNTLPRPHPRPLPPGWVVGKGILSTNVWT